MDFLYFCIILIVTGCLPVEPPDTPVRPKSMAIPERSAPWDPQLARALYAYLSSGENQLSFLEGDVIALMGKPFMFHLGLGQMTPGQSRWNWIFG